MKHTIKLLTLAAILTAVFGLTGCPGPVNNYIEPVHEHVFGEWSDWEVVTAATCAENGSKKRTRTCSCGEIEEETAVIAIDPNNHDFGEWSNWTTTIEVAYDHDGEKEHTRTCTRCGHSETEKVTVSRFVAGGYDGNDVPTENAETYRYQYADGIKFHLYVTTQEKYNERYPSNNNLTKTVRVYSITQSNDDIWDDYYLSFDASTYSELIEKYGNLFEMVRQFDGSDMVEYCKIPVDKLLGLKGKSNDFKWARSTSSSLNTEKDEFSYLYDNTNAIMDYYIVTTN